jgi:hypothetical protein
LAAHSPATRISELGTARRGAAPVASARGAGTCSTPVAEQRDGWQDAACCCRACLLRCRCASLDPSFLSLLPSLRPPLPRCGCVPFPSATTTLRESERAHERSGGSACEQKSWDWVEDQSGLFVAVFASPGNNARSFASLVSILHLLAARVTLHSCTCVLLKTKNEWKLFFCAAAMDMWMAGRDPFWNVQRSQLGRVCAPVRGRPGYLAMAWLVRA